MTINILGKSYSHCDGIRRREFLKAGAIGFGALSLADMLRLETAAGIRSSAKAVINVHLDGGPPHMDMIDLKPNAPSEIRGEFQPIATNVNGIQICELLPKIASIADKFAFIRSLVGAASRHDAFQCQSGYDEQSLKPIGGRPAMGCAVNKILGSADDPAPCFVDMMQGRPLVRNSARPGFLGPSFAPFRPNLSQMFSRPLEEGMKGELARRGANHTTELKLNATLDATRLEQRASLLANMDLLRRDMDSSGMMGAMDRFQYQAAGILTSGTFADALDISLEDPRVIEHYLPAHISTQGRSVTSDEPKSLQKFLIARRLVQAGVRCVSLTISDFDTHQANFPRLRYLLPLVDQGLYALVTDLERLGMLDDVSIVVWGEFGRTPKIAKNGGRDHWPKVGMCLLAGGGMKTGQVIGATDRLANAATERPVSYQEVFATLYHNLGINLAATTIPDPSGRPQYLLEHHEPIPELV
jgi:hypothetical protein